MLDIQRAIIEELYLETETFLRETDYDVSKFKLNDESAREFISSDLVEALEGREEVLSISYQAEIDGVEYRTIATADVNGNEIEIRVELYKKSGNEWLIYAGDNAWDRGPGENFF